MNRLVLLSIATLLGIAVYHSALIEVIGSILNREGSSHGFFVPVFTAMFLWSRRKALQKAQKRFELAAIPVAAVLLVVPVLLLESLRLEFICFVLYLASAVFLVFGRAAFKFAAFPVLFLIAMTPMTGEFYIQMAEATRFLTFHISVGALSVLGLTHYTEGWFVHLPNQLLEVALSCSGIRYLISYFVFGIAYAYLMKESTKSRVLLVALTIPFSILASSVRLITIFLMTYYISPKMAEYTPHLITSWTVFAVFLFGGMAVDQMITKYFHHRGHREHRGGLGKNEKKNEAY
jgi:exosortase